MGMSKEEFMARYMSDMAKKQKQKESIANSYSCERSHRTSKNTYARGRYRMSSTGID